MSTIDAKSVQPNDGQPQQRAQRGRPRIDGEAWPIPAKGEDIASVLLDLTRRIVATPVS